MKAIYWVIGVAVLGIGIFVYLLMGDTQRSIPKIKLSYFKNEAEIAESIGKQLQPELQMQKSFWVGVEPERPEHFEIVYQLKTQLEKAAAFTKVIVDSELNLPAEFKARLKVTDEVFLKDRIIEVGQLLAQLDKNSQSYFLVTANIYSNPILLKNQLHQAKEQYKIDPMTFSLAFFPVIADEEGKMMFQCRTEDHSGTADWGCTVANKARFTRRKVDHKNEMPWIGLMDLIGDKDYMILLKKK